MGHEFLHERMIGAKDRLTIFDSKYFRLDVIHGRINSVPKQFESEHIHAVVMLLGCVLMAGPQHSKNVQLAGGSHFAELVVHFAETTEVVLDN